MKDIIYIILSIILIFLIVSIFLLTLFSAYDTNLDMCLDTGFCKQDLKINTEYGETIINKANCLKYGWKWIEEDNACYLNNKFQKQ